MMQKKKRQEKIEDDKSGEGNASMDGVTTLEVEFKVGTSKMPSDSGALAAAFLLVTEGVTGGRNSRVCGDVGGKQGIGITGGSRRNVWLVSRIVCGRSGGGF
jgi:hypothetical protein